MILAFAAGILLQIAVTEIPPLIRLFGTVRLSLTEWLQLIALSATPLILHELLVAVGRKRYKGCGKEATQEPVMPEEEAEDR